MTLNNFNEKDVRNLLNREKQIQKNIYNKKEDDKRTAEWQMFYLNNMDVFTEKYLEIPLKQRLLNLGIPPT